MNKKFSTFLVGALLASSMSVVAQTGPTAGKYTESLPFGNSGNVYQLHLAPGTKPANFNTPTTTPTGAKELVVTDKGLLTLVPIGTGDFDASLWCVNVGTENQGKNPIFDFSNKAYGFNLSAAVDFASVAPATAPTKDLNIAFGNLAGWKLSATYEKSLEQGQYLATYFTPDSVLVLTSGPTQVGVKKYKANDPAIDADGDVLRVYIYTPGGHYLTAKEYNTVMGTYSKEDYRSLKFSKDRNNTSLKNPFSDYALKASAGTGDFLKFQRKGDDHFLRVDTTYANSVGVKFLNFAFGKEVNTTTVDGNLPIANQYEFLLEYFVHNDSIAIDVKEARYNLENEKVWANAMPTVWGAYSPGLGSPAPAGSILGTDSLHLKLQDLVTADEIRIITLGTTPVNTKAYWGIGGCTGGLTATSVDEDIYTIRNTRGQYLIVPVYTDSVYNAALSSRDNLFPAWVTLEGNIDANQIPAYQWIVEKTRTKDTENTSPLRIRNREFNVELPLTQLTTAEDGVIVEYGHLKPSGFVAVPKAQKEDPYLGYKFVDKEMSSVYTYVFNYLHNFDDSKYLGVNNTVTDSLMYVGGKTEFQIIPMAKEPSKYGQMPAHKEGNLKNVAQLVRHSYMLKIKDANKLGKSNKIVVVDKEKRYAVTDTSHLRTTVGHANWLRPEGIDTAIFYLKTNNTKALEEGGIRNYYALLDTNSFSANWGSTGAPVTQVSWMVKAGVDDDNLWVKVQDNRETRTSAFAIEVNDDPLYRRFNTEKEGSVANDTPDTVKFFRMNNKADMLYEDAYSNYSKKANPNAPKDQINFLGVQNNAQFPNTKYAIYVDTAFVARPATKDSKIETPKPQYMLVMDPQIVPPGSYCPVHGVGATCGHQVETEGFVAGRYLINATDSAKKSINPDVVRDERYIWDTKWERLVFVNAIHKGDTLYLLNEGFDIKEGQLITNEALQKISYTWFDLGNNLHKDVVFSFRLIGEGDNFLIESETTKRDTDNGLMIAPYEGGWVKVQNGVPVISRAAYDDLITEAERWNVVKTTEAPLANDEITVGDDFAVEAGIGTVTVKNAAGSNVTISNILGQTVASVALTNDNQTISVPAGIVVVAVEGEAAVKAIVK